MGLGALALGVGVPGLPAAAGPTGADITELLSLVNGERTARGLAPLRLEAHLTAGAAAHADALAAGGRLFHTTMRDAGPAGWTRLGENVAVAPDVREANRALMASPPHRELILEPAFDYIGLGVTHGPDGSHWVSMKLADHPSPDLSPGGPATTPVSVRQRVSAAGVATHADLPGVVLAAPIVGRVPTASGAGHWLVGSDGGVFSFGDATWHGSLAGTRLAAPIVGMTALPDGSGYWLAGADGGVFSFGAAPFLGSAGGEALSSAIASINRTSTGEGYAIRGTDGTRIGFGDAR